MYVLFKRRLKIMQKYKTCNAFIIQKEKKSQERQLEWSQNFRCVCKGNFLKVQEMCKKNQAATPSVLQIYLIRAHNHIRIYIYIYIIYRCIYKFIISYIYSETYLELIYNGIIEKLYIQQVRGTPRPSF